MAQQTAVEWLEQALLKPSNGMTLLSNGYIKELFVKAKEMEKQQHEKFNKFLDVEKVLGISDLKTIERIQWYYNNYFNENI